MRTNVNGGVAGELGYDQLPRQISEIGNILVQLREMWEHCGGRSRLKLHELESDLNVRIHGRSVSPVKDGGRGMKELTPGKLEAMTPEQRATLYENARKRRSSGGQAIMDFIDARGLPLSSGGMRITDPTYIRMREIIWANRDAAISATENGFPALYGVEKMIVRELGERYHPHDLGTANAGSLIAELMRHLGYVKDKEVKMPDNSVAKTAMRWKLRKK